MRDGHGDVRSPFVTSFDHLTFLHRLRPGGRVRGGVPWRRRKDRLAPGSSMLPDWYARGRQARRCVLAQTIPYLPPCVHVAVVDPGVGTARRGVAVRAAESILVGPRTTACCPGRWPRSAAVTGPSSSPTANCGCTGCRRPSTAGTSSCRPPRTSPPGPISHQAGTEIKLTDLVSLPRIPTSRCRTGRRRAR